MTVSPNLLRLLYFFGVGALGTNIAYLPLALRDRGLSYVEISALLATLPIVRIVSPPFWGFLADRYRLAPFLLRLTAWCTVFTYLPILAGGYFTAALFLSLFTLFYTPNRTLMDAVAFQHVATHGGSFGSFRAWGTIGYVPITLIGGLIADRVGAAPVVVSGTVFFLVAAILTMRIPSPPPSHPQPLLPALKVLLRKKGIALFFFITVVHTIGQATYDYFFPVHARELGFSPSLIGLSIALGGAAEAIVMLYSGKLMARYGARSLITFSAFVACFRWFLTGTMTSPYLLVPLQALHGITFGAWWIASATYIDAEAPPEIRASAQAIFYLMSYGVGALLALLIDGALAEVAGTPAIFIFASILTFVGGWLSFVSRNEHSSSIT